MVAMENIFPKSNDPKVNVIVLLEFELVDYNIRVQCDRHYATRTSSFSLYALSNSLRFYVAPSEQN